ncbi:MULTISPECIES: Uma2 family endonuclease [Moorena]|uniref:Putative restriction endonuclease domain-containing protein n=1 Tax=Moorena producens 3L TaxID=489825 RepID=F4XY58_9CYAN|nr:MULTISPECIES: Uma2 family endonuclease [Moorena]EGJ30455.1 hypothetical protein LYNGBM3L_50150 [Moorena producens 3L]NEP65887.1 Uma2 family endonuclease [Moorena sp. SIO3A5]NEQ10093.1 Uma2 family endonuclease [Moorena sp. SIO4E2]NER87375.1 Uma2 family endonuclease [Moorena sp. SIO3A2]NET65893.1 Uma2 family endonuclease [Moorena sp. SIO1G6]
MLPTITPTTIDLAPGTQLRFPGTWEDYEQLLVKLGDRASIRMRFRDNQILLMAPLPEHGNQADILADLVKALLRYEGKDWQSFDPITLRQGGMPGVEPDACFYIQNYQAILGKRRLDLSQDPPPDLALEIDLTSITDINDYIPLAVPEVWIYKADTIHIYRFESGRYLEVQTSEIFPNFPVKETIPQYINKGWQFGSSVALREFVGLLGEEGSRE